MPSPQAPIHSGYGAASTAAQVMDGVSLAGKTAIVTGGYSGLGLETVRVLAQAGASIIVPARSPERAQSAINGLGLPGIRVQALDLQDPASIAALADAFLAGGQPLHLLVNSAGIMASPLQRDARGYESQFSTNHLGHFQLARRLWPALQRAQGARIVSVSSRGHHIAPVDLDDIHFERRAYDKWVAYGQAKTANALFAVGADARGERDGIRAFSLHPGSVLGPLARHLTTEEIATFGVHDAAGQPINAPERDMKNAAQGAATIAWCAASPALHGMGGVYCENSDIAELTTGEQKYGVRPWAADAALAERLWLLSEAMSS